MNTQLYYLVMQKAKDESLIGYAYKVLHIYNQNCFLGRHCDEWGNTRAGAPACNVVTGFDPDMVEGQLQGQFFDSLQDLQQYASECGVTLPGKLLW